MSYPVRSRDPNPYDRPPDCRPAAEAGGRAAVDHDAHPRAALDDAEVRIIERRGLQTEPTTLDRWPFVLPPVEAPVPGVPREAASPMRTLVERMTVDALAARLVRAR